MAKTQLTKYGIYYIEREIVKGRIRDVIYKQIISTNYNRKELEKVIPPNCWLRKLKK